MLLRLFATAFLVLFSLLVYAQRDTKQCQWTRVSEEPFQIDSLSLLPESIELRELPDSSLKIVYDINIGKAMFNKTSDDSVLVCYHVLPYDLSKRFFNRDPILYDTNQYYREETRYGSYGYPIGEKDQLLNTPGINKSGSVTRGISFGNNQNVFVNSALNLQMDGKITDQVGITASISDQNIPFQPEGNTQQLQEFDKVFIQLHTPRSRLTAGDLVMKNHQGYFLKYYRNVQGGLFEGNYIKDSVTSSFTMVGAAVSKGKFASIQLKAMEGIQGPYRLTGPNNERFIIVLANSEKIYLDGKLLTRGFDYDYVIDYNQAEITFTANVVITRYSIIRVDFEYSDKNYGRSNIMAGHYQSWKKLSGYINYYLQKDNPNNPLQYNLSGEERSQLAMIGDDLSQAVISGADSVGFQEGRVMYKRIDSLGTWIYIASSDPGAAFYEVVFTDVGLGNGDYILKNSTSNGRVYMYEGPGKGSYLPVRLVATPKKNQMVTIGGAFDPDEATSFYGEVAFSENDQNLYSSMDNGDNGGKAVKIGMVNKGKTIGFLGAWKLTNSIDFEFTERNFRQIDRFRDVNYERDWSADLNTERFNRVVNASFGFVKDKDNLLRYDLSRRIKGGEVDGLQQSLSLSRTFGKLYLNGKGWMMYNNQALFRSDWTRVNLHAAWNGKLFSPGVIYSSDKNRVATPEGSLLSSAMYYDELKFYVKSNDTSVVAYAVDYAIRENSDTLQGAIVKTNRSRTLTGTFNTLVRQRHAIRAQVAYRYLDYYEHLPYALKDEETFITRMDWNSDFLQRHVRSELTLTTGTGRELKREFFYQEVPQGTGTHVWEDFNADGSQDLNEFIEKVPGLAYNQKEYIRVFMPTDEYVNAYTGSINYRLDLYAPRHWRGHENMAKNVFSRFSSTSSWSVNNKVLTPDIAGRFFPSQSSEEATILSNQNGIRGNLFFNRTNPIYGMDLLYAVSESKSLLTQGFETVGRKDLTYNTRFNVKRFYHLKLALGRSLKSSASDFLTQKNYLIEAYSLRPEFAYQPTTDIRITGKLSYTDKVNVASIDRERVLFYEAGLDTRFSKVSQRTISGEARYIRIAADLKDVPVGSALGYEMLEALRPGNNFTWTINWQEKLVSGLQLSFIYEGRKSEGSATIHTGRVQASAFF